MTHQVHDTHCTACKPRGKRQGMGCQEKRLMVFAERESVLRDLSVYPKVEISKDYEREGLPLVTLRQQVLDLRNLLEKAKATASADHSKPFGRHKEPTTSSTKARGRAPQAVFLGDRS